MSIFKRFHGAMFGAGYSKFFTILVLCISIFDVFMLFHAPIFPDEIVWRFLYSRFFIDGFEHFSYFKPCLAETLPIPIFLYPQFVFFSLFAFLDSAFFYRAIPFIGYACLLIVLYKNYQKISLQKQFCGFLIFLFIVSTLGNSGSVWIVTSRSEFLLFYFMSFAVLIGMRKSVSAVLVVLLFLFWTILSIAHPKFLYLFPIIIYLLWFTDVKKTSKVLLSCIVVFYLLFLVKFNNELIFTNCKNQIREFYDWLQGFNANPLNLFANPKYFFQELYAKTPIQLHMIMTRASDHLSYIDNRQSPFLPNVRQSFFSAFSNYFIKFLFITHLLAGLFFISSAIKKYFKNFGLAIANVQENIVLLLYIFVYTIIFFNRTTNAYDITLWLVSIAFLNVLSIYYLINRPSVKIDVQINSLPIFKFILKILFLVFVVNSSLFFSQNFKWFKSNKNNSWSGMSVPQKYLSKNVSREMRDDYQSNCHVNSDNPLYLFDDHTYNSVFKNFSGKIIAPVTYTMLPFYNDHEISVGKKNLDAYLDRYSQVIFYGSCDFGGELPASFRLKNRNDSLGMCCFVR